jgi:hypothetical protein
LRIDLNLAPIPALLQAILNSSQIVATARRSPQKSHATEFLFIYLLRRRDDHLCDYTQISFAITSANWRWTRFIRLATVTERGYGSLAEPIGTRQVLPPCG